MGHKESIKRQFSAKSQNKVELLTLSLDHLWNMKHEFSEPYEDIFNNAYSRLNKCLKIKLKAIKYQNEKKRNNASGYYDKSKSMHNE